MSNKSDLFTSTDVARLCGVDLKTIHNWADKGEIACFRTPGRHLRFRPTDVYDFMVRTGFPVPKLLERLVKRHSARPAPVIEVQEVEETPPRPRQPITLPPDPEERSKVQIIGTEAATSEMRAKLSETCDVYVYDNVLDAILALTTVEPEMLVIDPTGMDLDAPGLIRTLREHPVTKGINIVTMAPESVRRRRRSSANIVMQTLASTAEA